MIGSVGDLRCAATQIHSHVSHSNKCLFFCFFGLCTLYVHTPIHREPIKVQTANLGVSPLVNDPTNEQLTYSHQTHCKDDWLREKESGWGSAPLWYVMITATELYAIKMMRYFPIVPKRFRAPICLHFAAVFWRAGAGERSHEAFWGGKRREEEEEWGGLSHIWRPEMEQNSMSNIWNSNCIM